MPVSAGRRAATVAIERLAAAADDRPVFIGGCPRSGTTLLGAMLHSHPASAIPPETRFVVESYGKRFGDLRDESNRRRVGQWITRTPSTRFAELRLDAGTVVEAVAAAPPTIGSLSGAVLRTFAEAYGKPRWGDKRPKYVEQLPVLFRLYPDAQFIHIVRDARGCTASLKRLGWWGWGAVEALDRWRRSINAGLKAREVYRADQYIELRYEDLVTDPEPELTRVCAFLGLDYDGAMLSDHTTGASLIGQPYHHRLAQPVNTGAVSAWREDLDAAELALVQQQVGPLLDEFGYARLPDLDAVPPDLEQRYMRYRRRRSLVEQRDRLLLQAGRLGSRGPVAAQLTSAQRALAARG